METMESFNYTMFAIKPPGPCYRWVDGKCEWAVWSPERNAWVFPSDQK